MIPIPGSSHGLPHPPCSLPIGRKPVETASYALEDPKTVPKHPATRSLIHDRIFPLCRIPARRAGQRFPLLQA